MRSFIWIILIFNSCVLWFVFFLVVVSYECWFFYGGVFVGKMGFKEFGDSNYVCGKDFGIIGYLGKGDKEA